MPNQLSGLIRNIEQRSYILPFKIKTIAFYPFILLMLNVETFLCRHQLEIFQ